MNFHVCVFSFLYITLISVIKFDTKSITLSKVFRSKNSDRGNDHTSVRNRRILVYIYSPLRYYPYQCNYTLDQLNGWQLSFCHRDEGYIYWSFFITVKKKKEP